MKKNLKSKVLIVLGLLSTSCASLQDHKNDLKTTEFDKVQIGQSKDTVVKYLGTCSEIRTSSENEELWIYNENNDVKSQLGAVSFDPRTHEVSSKTIVPQDGEREKSLTFLIDQKFNSSHFEKVPLLRCQRDYFPSVVFYINAAAGIIIKYDSNLGIVKNISWTSPGYASAAVNKIKNCEF